MSPTYSQQQINASVTALRAYQDISYVSHEWEELVLRLSHDIDPKMRELMYREMDKILEKDPGFNIFRMS